MLEFTFGPGLAAVSFKLLYKEKYASPQAQEAIRKLFKLVSDPKHTSFGDADMSSEIGLGSPEVVSY